MTSRTNITHTSTGGRTGERAAHSEEIQGQELGCDIMTAHRGDPGQSGTEGPGVVSVRNFSGGLCSVRSSVCYVESERVKGDHYSPIVLIPGPTKLGWPHPISETTAWYPSPCH